MCITYAMLSTCIGVHICYTDLRGQYSFIQFTRKKHSTILFNPVTINKITISHRRIVSPKSNRVAASARVPYVHMCQTLCGKNKIKSMTFTWTTFGQRFVLLVPVVLFFAHHCLMLIYVYLH